MDRLGSLVFIAPTSEAGDSGSNTGPGKNFSLKLLIIEVILNYISANSLTEQTLAIHIW